MREGAAIDGVPRVLAQRPRELVHLRLAHETAPAFTNVHGACSRLPPTIGVASHRGDRAGARRARPGCPSPRTSGKTGTRVRPRRFFGVDARSALMRETVAASQWSTKQPPSPYRGSLSLAENVVSATALAREKPRPAVEAETRADASASTSRRAQRARRARAPRRRTSRAREVVRVGGASDVSRRREEASTWLRARPMRCD